MDFTPIITKHKPKLKLSYSPKNIYSNLKLPSLFHNQFINEMIIEEKKKNEFMSFFLHKCLGYNSKILNKILYEKETNLIFRNYFQKHILIRNKSFKIKDTYNKTKTLLTLKENVVHNNLKQNFPYNKNLNKKIKLKKCIQVN